MQLRVFSDLDRSASLASTATMVTHVVQIDEFLRLLAYVKRVVRYPLDLSSVGYERIPIGAV